MDINQLKSKAGKVLTEALISGYAGKGKINDVSRSVFKGKSSHVESKKGICHDEWFVPTHIGGGQELVRINNEQFTRLYGGGTPSPEKLKEIGVDVKEVAEYLKRKLIELKDKTRLFEECKPDPDRDWSYSYEQLYRNDQMSVYIFIETIKYKEIVVHIHPIILSPVS